MSTQQTDIGKQQETLPQAPPSLHSQQVREVEQLAPAHIFSQPPRPPRPRSQYWIVLALAALLLVIAMSVGMLLLIPLTQHPANQVTPTPTQVVTPTPGTIDTTPTPPPGVTPGPQTGPPGVSDSAYWDKILGTKLGVNKVESVSFANIMNTPTLQALVTVRYTGSEARLDVYVFTNITSARNTCGIADNVDATHVFLGNTSTKARCASRDHRNVIGFRALDFGVLAVTCFWTFNGRMVEADMQITTREHWALSKATCNDEPLLEATVTHEAGHVYGLDHVGERRHGRLTMSPFLDGPCNNNESTLGRGDIRGLQQLY